MDPDENLDEQRDVADLLRSTIEAGSDDEAIGALTVLSTS